MVNFSVLEISAPARDKASLIICFLLTALALFFVISTAGASGQHVNVDSEGYSMNRYDPVAYFVEGRPLRGDREYTAVHQDVKYAFVSESNRELFLSDPDKYVPQYGGYCAFGAVHGNKSEVDSEVWEIVDGKLYLLVSAGTKSIWEKKKKNYIEIANEAWTSITEQR